LKRHSKKERPKRRNL